MNCLKNNKPLEYHIGNNANILFVIVDKDVYFIKCILEQLTEYNKLNKTEIILFSQTIPLTFDDEEHIFKSYNEF